MLRVDIGGDGTGFLTELKKAKAEAAKFAGQMDAESKKSLAAAQANVGRLERQISQKQAQVAQKGVAAANLAMQAGQFAPPQVASGLALLTTGFFTLKEASMALGVSFLKAAGAAGAFALAAFSLGKLGKENVDLYKAANAETKALAQEIAQSGRTVAAYDKAILEAKNKGKINEERATKLRVAIRSNDFETQRNAFREVRGIATGPDKKLLAELSKARVENMPDGRAKDMAMARLQYTEQIKELADKLKGATSTDKAAIGALAREAQIAFQKKMGEVNRDWDKKDLEAAEKAKRDRMKDVQKPTRPESDSLAQVGLFTRQFLATGGLEDTAKKQLAVLKSIDRKTVPPSTQTANPFQ